MAQGGRAIARGKGEGERGLEKEGKTDNKEDEGGLEHREWAKPSTIGKLQLQGEGGEGRTRTRRKEGGGAHHAAGAVNDPGEHATLQHAAPEQRAGQGRPRACIRWRTRRKTGNAESYKAKASRSEGWRGDTKDEEERLRPYQR